MTGYVPQTAAVAMVLDAGTPPDTYSVYVGEAGQAAPEDTATAMQLDGYTGEVPQVDAWTTEDRALLEAVAQGVDTLLGFMLLVLQEAHKVRYGG